MMRKLFVFNSISLDGYFTDAKGDMSWAHKNDPEFNEFTAENAKQGGTLVFGRVTYDLMNGFWPTEAAQKMFPDVAKGMNEAEKIVFSKSLERATWNNTRLINDNIVEEMRQLKEEPGDGLVIMGSGTIVSQFTEAGLIDEYQVLINPIVLGSGRTMFAGVKSKVNLNRTNFRTFRNGNVLATYELVK